MKKTSILFSFTLVVLMLMGGLTTTAQAQDIVGKWISKADSKDTHDGVVEITEKDGKYYGSIIWSGAPEGSKDENNADEKLRSRTIVGMQMLSGFKKDGDQWSGGKIYNPRDGKTYKCKMWFEGENLHIRGYVGASWMGLGKTSIWNPLPAGHAAEGL